MFDMKYHIASLVAVFLALAVGIVLGTAIVNKGLFAQQQSALVQSLRKEFVQIRDRNRTLEDQVSADSEFFKSAVPLVLDKKLAGRKVAIVSTDTDDSVMVRQAAATMKQAGASVAIVTVLRADLGTTDKATAEKLSKVFLPEKPTGDVLKKKLLSALSTQLIGPTEPAFLQQLADIGVIQVSGAQALPAQSVVVLAGRTDKGVVGQIQTPVIEQLKKTNLVVVGAEATDLKESIVPTYQRLGISTVDNLDSPIGQVSLALAVAGTSGNYGVKNTADELMPRLEAR